MQSELKPCPFCGGEAHMRGCLLDERFGYAGVHEITCDDCEASIKRIDKQRHGDYPAPTSKPEAITAWNARATDAEITRLTEALRAAEEREKGLREALAFYARENSWKSCGMYMSGRPNPSSAELDAGNKARQALAGAKP